MMSDIGNPAVALMMDGRLISAARLQVVSPDKFHIGGLGRSPDRLRLGMSAGAERNQKYPERCRQFDVTGHVFPPQAIETNLCWLIGNDIIAKRARIALSLVD